MRLDWGIIHPVACKNIFFNMMHFTVFKSDGCLDWTDVCICIREIYRTLIEAAFMISLRRCFESRPFSHNITDIYRRKHTPLYL